MGSILNLVYEDKSTIDFYKDLMHFYKIDEYKLFSLCELENSDIKYYYIYATDRYLAPLFNEFGGFPFNNDLKKSIKQNKNLFVIFLNEHESDNEDCLKLLKTEIQKNHFCEKQFYFISNNNRLEELKIKENTEINVYRVNRAPFVSVREMANYPHPFVSNREFLFMTHNRAIKSHRIGLLCLLRNNNLLHDTDWSLIRGFEFKQRYFDESGFNKWFLKGIFNDNDFNICADDIEFFRNINVKKSDFEIGEEFDFPPYLLMRNVSYEMNCYSHSYINVTTETHYETPYLVQISEKSFLPFYFFQIPIFVATFEHVKKIREIYDYDMFDDIVDHSYDNEYDNTRRLKMIINELKRLRENKDQIFEFFKLNKHRFLKNRELVLKQLTDKSDYNFFKSLSL
jgi:hypothetical protein